jgi:hypothetical protein
MAGKGACFPSADAEEGVEDSYILRVLCYMSLAL